MDKMRVEVCMEQLGVIRLFVNRLQEASELHWEQTLTQDNGMSWSEGIEAIAKWAWEGKNVKKAKKAAFAMESQLVLMHQVRDHEMHEAFVLLRAFLEA